MRIRNRLPDFKKLQTHVLQDYLKIILEENNLSNDWKHHFELFVHNQYYNGYKNNVSHVYDQIILYGLDSYSITKMDTSLIINYLTYGNLRIADWNKIKSLLSNLQSDRNIDAHTNSNETDSELFEYAVISLNNLKIFIEAVWRDRNADPNPRTQLAKIYLPQIQEMNAVFSSDLKESFYEEQIDEQIKRDIATILHSNNKSKTWSGIFGKNYRLSKSDLESHNIYLRFLLMASEAGISFSYEYLADYYYYGAKSPEDYQVAAHYLELAVEVDVPNPHHYLCLANIYHNKLGTNSPKYDVDVLLKKWKSTSFGSKRPVSLYKTDKGYEFFDYTKPG